MTPNNCLHLKIRTLDLTGNPNVALPYFGLFLDKDADNHMYLDNNLLKFTETIYSISSLEI
jgi:hypothetical protein